MVIKILAFAETYFQSHFCSLLITQESLFDMGKSIIFNDDSIVNDYGFRLMTAGIQLERFKKNPILLYCHQRSSKYGSPENTALPIGKVDNLRVEGTLLIGDPIFDTKDEFAIKISNKVDEGIINMGSIGANPITTSSDPVFLLPGQICETVVQSQLLELSLADIGGNENCVALYNNDGVRINLSNGNENPIPRIKTTEETPNQITDMKSIALLLGMPEGATEQEIHAKITLIMGANQTMTTELTSIRDARILELVNQGITERKFTADKKDQMLTLGSEIGPARLKSTIELMSPAIKPGEIINHASGTQGAIVELTFDELRKKGVKGIEEYKREHPQEYIKLYHEKFGVDPQDKALEV